MNGLSNLVMMDRDPCAADRILCVLCLITVCTSIHDKKCLQEKPSEAYRRKCNSCKTYAMVEAADNASAFRSWSGGHCHGRRLAGEVPQASYRVDKSLLGISMPMKCEEVYTFSSDLTRCPLSMCMTPGSRKFLGLGINEIL
jgi:hypothetical protein